MSDVNAALRQLIATIEDWAMLDRPAAVLQSIAEPLIRAGSLKRVLSGAQLGHPAHPMLTDIPIGCWSSASLIDVMAGRSGRAISRQLTGAGVLAAFSTVATGLVDWTTTRDGDRRVGVVHAAGNSVALLFEVASWSARRNDRHARGVALGMCAIGVATFAGVLGGHLAFGTKADTEQSDADRDGTPGECGDAEAVV